MTRTGVKTTEFWVVAIAGLAAAFIPDFPKEALISLGVWIAGRASQKYFGMEDIDGKRAWKTSEFWAALATTGLVGIFPDMPKESMLSLQGFVATYVASRVVVKKAQVPPTGETNVTPTP
jgi:hypothetical protein